MKGTRILKTILLLIALSILVISIYFLGEIRGIQQGDDAAIAREFPNTAKISLVAHGPNFYDEVASAYLIIVTILGLYSLIKLFSLSSSFAANRVHLIASCLLLIVGGYFLGNMISFKGQVLQLSSSSFLPYHSWLGYSLPFDWFCALLLLALFLADIISSIFLYRRTEV